MLILIIINNNILKIQTEPSPLELPTILDLIPLCAYGGLLSGIDMVELAFSSTFT